MQFKKPTVTNERLVVNKLGMKFDPVCWKKNHEKGRIQFICIVVLVVIQRKMIVKQKGDWHVLIV